MCKGGINPGFPLTDELETRTLGNGRPGFDSGQFKVSFHAPFKARLEDLGPVDEGPVAICSTFLFNESIHDMYM